MKNLPTEQYDDATRKLLIRTNTQQKQTGKRPITLKELMYVMKHGVVKIRKHSDHTGYINMTKNQVCEKCGYPIIQLLQGNKYTTIFDRNVYEIDYCSNIYCENHKPQKIGFMKYNTFSVSKEKYMYKTLSLSDSIDYYKRNNML